MAEAVLVDVANALKEVVAAHSFGMAFDCELSYADVTRTLEDLTGKLHIDIVPFRSPSQFNARQILEYQCTVDVIARKKFAGNEKDISSGRVTTEEINRLIKLMQDVDEFFLTNATAKELTLSSGGWKGRIKSTDRKLDYSRPHLYTHGQFTGWIRVTYLAAKEV